MISKILLWFRFNFSQDYTILQFLIRSNDGKCVNNNVTRVSSVNKWASVPQRCFSSLKLEKKKGESKKSIKRKGFKNYPPLPTNTPQVETFPFDKITVTIREPLKLIFVEPNRIYPREKAIENKVVPLSDYLYFIISFSLLMGTCYFIYDMLFKFCKSQNTIAFMDDVDICFFIIFTVLYILIVKIIRMHYSFLILSFNMFVNLSFITWFFFPWDVKDRILRHWEAQGQEVIWAVCFLILICIMLLSFLYIETLYVIRCWRSYTRTFVESVMSWGWLLVVLLSVWYIYLWLIGFFFFTFNIGFLSEVAPLEYCLRAVHNLAFQPYNYVVDYISTSIILLMVTFYIKEWNKWVYAKIPIEDIFEVEW